MLRNNTAKLASYKNAFECIEPFEGTVSSRFVVDFLGVLTRKKFREKWLSLFEQSFRDEDAWIETTRPTPDNAGEFWFEALNWVESAKEAKDTYVMFSLGAHFGYQAVGAALALKKLNPLPFKLVCVEPEPTQIGWIKQHMSDNGIKPSEYWIVPLVLNASTDPVFFPVGAPGSGAQNSFSTNEEIARKNYVSEIIKKGKIEESLSNLILKNTTSINKTLVPETDMIGEIKILSATTLSLLLGPFDYVDFIESDIQESEKIVFPECIEVLTEKVKRISIGTHGKRNHEELVELFKKAKWEIIFDFLPETTHQTDLGSLEMNDGVLVVVNPFINK